MDNVTSIGEHQPHMVVNMGDSVHVLPLSLVRAISNGTVIATSEQAAVIARAFIDCMED
jgi:hypothetical protein